MIRTGITTLRMHGSTGTYRTERIFSQSYRYRSISDLQGYKTLSGHRFLSTTPDRKSENDSRQQSFLSLPSTFSRITALSKGAKRIYERTATTSYGRLMRLDKPIGTHLLFLPGAWGIAIASNGLVEAASLTALFYGGAVIMRGAGCTINDIWDADIDSKVKRTKDRPIASGEISIPSAFVFLGAQMFAGLGILTQLRTECFLLATVSILPVMFYPFSKRYLSHPQAILGLTFNWGALLGYCAATGTLAPPAFYLYGAGWCWTMVYDTIYAHQDKEDDMKVGIESSALQFGSRSKLALAGLTATKLALLTGAGMSADLSLPYFAGIAASTTHLGYHVLATDLNDPKQCWRAFVSNEITGTLTWLAIVLGRVF